jgi:hypothetical protein
VVEALAIQTLAYDYVTVTHGLGTESELLTQHLSEGQPFLLPCS